MSTQTEIEFAAPTGRDTRVANLPEPIAFTADQVCAALQISKVTLWRLERRGLLSAIPHLRHKRFSAEQVRRFARG